MIRTQNCPLCRFRPIELKQAGKYNYGLCPRCGGTFKSSEELPSPAEELARYKLHNNNVGDPGYRNFLRPLVDLVLSRRRPGERGLDFGAGPGPLISELLEEQGFAMALYDPFFHPDKSALTTNYDFIICCETAEHFHDPRASFNRLSGLLAPGGILFCRTSLAPAWEDFSKWYYKEDITHVFFYNEKTIAWIADNIMKCGYTIIDRNLFYFSR